MINHVQHMQLLKSKVKRELQALRQKLPVTLNTVDKARVLSAIEIKLHNEVHCVPRRGQDFIDHVNRVLENWRTLNIHQLPTDWEVQLQDVRKWLDTEATTIKARLYAH